jgi:cell wall-associated NlpC family hydrolase
MIRIRIRDGAVGMVGDMRIRRGVVIGAVAAALVLGTVTWGNAAPRQDIAAVADQVRELQMAAEAANERAKEAQQRLERIQGELGAIQNRADRERGELRTVSATIEDIARATYASGGIDPTLQVILAEDPIEFLAQAAVMGQLEEAQAADLRRAQTTRLRLAQTEAELQDREANAESVRNEVNAARSDAQAQLDAAETLLATLQEEERQRLEQLERERQAARAAAAAAAAEEARRLAAQQQQAADAAPSVDGPDESGGGFAGGSRAAVAIQTGLAQLGEPYSYSANPPSSWDCSKFTTYAWAQAGVSLTPYSYAQWDQTRRVPLSDIQPGDLVFYFGRGAHHVGLYIGNGKMVHAANPGDDVTIDDIMGPWYAERFSGVGRVIG